MVVLRIPLSRVSAKVISTHKRINARPPSARGTEKRGMESAIKERERERERERESSDDARDPRYMSMQNFKLHQRHDTLMRKENMKMRRLCIHKYKRHKSNTNL